MASSSSITPSSVKKYDVFLSWSDERSPSSFTSRVYDVLLEKKISTFIDDIGLQRGDEISPAILNAIEESRISLIIFSKDYAVSRSRLDELVKIIECKKHNNQIVIPVFYDIDPSHVRKQTGPFVAAFKNHGAHPGKSVQKWRDALTEASNVSGFDLHIFKSEAALTQVIVDDILKKLYKKFEKRWSIGDILKRYKVHKDEKALYVDTVNFIKPYYSSHKDEEAFHYDIVNLIKRCSEDKDEEAIHDPKITAEWIFAITNLILEVPSALIDKLSSVHKPQYALVSMLLSFTTMLICIIQLVYQGGEARVGWRWRPKKIPWFYYPPPGDKPFGTVTDFIGLLCAIFQSIFTAIDYASYLRNINDPIKISIWPLVFSFCLLCSTFFKESPEKVFAFCLLCSTFFKESPKEEASTESTALAEDNV